MYKFLAGTAMVLAMLGLPAAAQRAPASETRPPVMSGAARVREVPSLERPDSPRARRYNAVGYALYFAGRFWSLAVLALLLRLGIAVRWRDRWGTRIPPALLPVAIGGCVLLLLSVAALPIRFYGSFLLQHEFGLSRQTLPGWAWDWIRSVAVSCGIGALLTGMVYWTIRRSPSRWWIGCSALLVPLIFAGAYLRPMLLDPMFHRFYPLEEGPLRTRVLSLAARAGVPADQVWVADRSRRTNAVNAYVTGWGGSARIVLWDTLLQRLDEDEVVAVAAHEMGHYREGHVPLGLLLASAGTFGVLWLMHVAASLCLRRGSRWGIRCLADPASLPLLLLLLYLVNFLGSPVEAAISRTLERRADLYALRLTGDGAAAARAFVKLSEANLTLRRPPRWAEVWFYSHPPLEERIRTALSWSERDPKGMDR